MMHQDVSKLQYPTGLTRPQRYIVRDLCFLSSKQPGAQQIRRIIGHALFGARVEFGEPLFITISPSSRHSGMVLRLSRYRSCDPGIAPDVDARIGMRPWRQIGWPNVWRQESTGGAACNVPGYKCRTVIAARDPWAVTIALGHSVRYVLPRLL